jgi:hypothetical protein
VLSVLADRDDATGEAKNRRLALTKARDGIEGPIAPFSLRFVPLGQDDDGASFGTCAVTTLIAPPTAGTAPPRLTKNQETLFAILHAAGAAGLTTEEWNDRAREAGLGIARKADLYDLRRAIEAKKLVHQHDNRWKVTP